MEDFVTELVPTSQWVYNLARVTYHRDEDADAECVRYIAYAFENHLIADIEDAWPASWLTYYKWEDVAENIGHPRVIGNIYGHPMYEDGKCHGQRIAEKKNLKG